MSASSLDRYRLRIWQDRTLTKNLLLFAQSIDIQLFDHTYDSFRAPVLNSHKAALEMSQLITSCAQGKAKHGALPHSIEEFKMKVGKDSSISNEKKKLYQGIAKEIQSNFKNKQKLNDMINLLLADMNVHYYEELKSEIVRLVQMSELQDGLVDLAASYIAELELRGFDRRYIYKKNIKFFFSDRANPRVISSAEVISDFLHVFDQDKKNWTVLLAGARGFLDYTENANAFGIGVLTELPENLSALVKAREFAALFPDSSLISVKVEAKDPHSASNVSRKVAEFFSDICRFHGHKTELEIQGKTFVRQDPAGNSVFIEKEIDPLLCGVEQRLYEDRSSINRTISIFSRDMSGRNSSDYFLFMKALDFHHAAMQSVSEENKLLNLWAAIEGFLPSTGEDSDSIVHYSKYIISVMTLTYCHSYVSAILREVRLSPVPLENFLDGIQGDSVADKFLRLLSCAEHEDNRARLLSATTGHPLLCVQLSRLFSCLKSPSRVKDFISRHRDKLNLHLSRIYTARNAIVHDASYSMSHSMRTLLINLHNYFDTLIHSVSFVSGDMFAKCTTHAAVEFLLLSEALYVEKIGRSGDQFTVDNYKDIFGVNNPLSPYYAC